MYLLRNNVFLFRAIGRARGRAIEQELLHPIMSKSFQQMSLMFVFQPHLPYVLMRVLRHELPAHLTLKLTLQSCMCSHLISVTCCRHSNFTTVLSGGASKYTLPKCSFMAPSVNRNMTTCMHSVNSINGRQILQLIMTFIA